MVMGHPLRGRQALNWPACSRASRDDDTRWDLVFAWTARKLAWYHLPTLTVDRDRVYVYYTLRRVLLLWESVAGGIMFACAIAHTAMLCGTLFFKYF